MSSTITPLRDGKIIPDILAEIRSLSGSLTVTWPNVTLDSPGKELDREATQPQPTVTVSGIADTDGKKYVLIMTDPDLMANNDQNFGQVRHWLATNVTIGSDGKVDFSTGDAVSPYIGPAPLPNYISPRPHRYIFILAQPERSGQVTCSADDFKAIQQKYTAAFEGKQDLQDLKDRWGFDAQALLSSKSLKPVAVTYMLVGGTLKSTVDNMAMTGEAILNKTLGK